MKKQQSVLDHKISTFKKKYYTNLLIKHCLSFVALILVLILVSSSLEFSFEFQPTGRALILYFSIFLLLFYFYKLILRPYLKLIRTSDQMSNEVAARLIGEKFPELKDKLLNTIQLSADSRKDNSLLIASIEQRTSELKIFDFKERIDFYENKKYIKYIAYPGFVLLSLLLVVPQFITESTNRIINYNTTFENKQFFTITPNQSDFFAFKNEPFNVEMKVTGTALPKNIYVNALGRDNIMKLDENGIASYTFNKVATNFDFRIKAADYLSPIYHLKVLHRPDIKRLNISLEYPIHTGEQNRILENTGNLMIPEGTKVNWMIEAIKTDSIQIIIENPNQKIFLKTANKKVFNGFRHVFQSTGYNINLRNKNSANKDAIHHQITVIKDQLPKIYLDYYQDTIRYDFLIFNGNISDDYGISKLELVYQIKNKEVTIVIPHQSDMKIQNYYYQWILDSLALKEGEELSYYLRVWDNDRVNGYKYAKTGTYSFKIPKKYAIKENMNKQSATTKKELETSLKDIKNLNKQIKNIQQKLKIDKKEVWKEKKKINDLIQQKEKLKKELDKIAKQNKSLMQKQKRFNKPNTKLLEKAKLLETLMDELLDEDTKKLYDELKKLLNEQKENEEIEDLMNQIENKEENLEKKIERAIEMFKRMQFEYKMDEIINDLDQLEKEQKKLSEDVRNRKNSTEELQKEQEKKKKAFEEIQENLDQLDKLNEAMKEPEQMEDFSQEKSDIEQKQKESKESLENSKRKKASDQMKKASDQMKSMKEKMSKTQMSMEMNMMQENMQHLQDIIDNLIKISFDQENIMLNFKKVNQSDPRYITLSQNQLKLRDDAVIIEDSLLALANRVFQIKSFVTREIDQMNDYIAKSLTEIKKRKKPQAIVTQQYAMTSINNLALLLSDVLKQMQQQMSDAMDNPQKGKKGKKKNMSSLSQMQQQLNKKIEELKKSGKSGRALSKELSQLSAEQEMLRNSLQKIMQKLGENEKEGKGNLNKAIGKMEETELDLVNKRLTQHTINRQKEILTRMLKAEEALRKRELDKEREAEQATNTNKQIPAKFEEYIKAKQKKLELLNTVSPKMNPYYKEEVKKYFRRTITE